MGRPGHLFAIYHPWYGFIFCLVILLELEESVQRVPTIRLLENAICQRLHRSTDPTSPIDEKMCKGNPVQVQLAYYRGLLSFFDSLPLILFGSVIGNIADCYGRRITFALAVFGTLCSMGWIYMTCSLWDILPVEVVWLSSLFRLIGGGPAIAIAICLTMVSDLSEESNRSKGFYRVYSAVLITDFIGPLITYRSLQYSLWLPYVVCGVSLLLTFPILYHMPETLPERASQERGMSALNFSGIKVYLKFLADYRIVIGIATVFLAQFRANLIEILLPYVSVRFDIELGKVATLLSVVSAVNILAFLIALPAISTALEKRAGWSITDINICVARASSFLLGLGAATLAVAPTLSLVIIALIVYALGFGVRLSILAVLTSYIPIASDTAKLYTLVATTDAIAHLIASPMLQFTWSRALKIGGRWLALPFMLLTFIFFTAFLVSCFMKGEPKQSVDEYPDEEREPLLVAGEEGDNENR
ncbi:Siderophore transporter, RhtX/FptX family [Penicillium camemberti]|uniref:Siderophore transporter, RhtX/FptX family n=1 Tax=Penicillium camemberti (strain FM 013) TaxID=1429867 RepID=A0A0G4P7A9_PENC3|nr:Siderophore transporter, RhtX/FptX family [Penicillium camemberti]